MRILVLEDEPLIALMLADWLQELGHDVVGPFGEANRALPLIDGGGIDAALLDLHLRDGDSCAVATRLQSDGIPFAFASGDGGNNLPQAYRGCPILAKPFQFESIEALLQTWG